MKPGQHIPRGQRRRWARRALAMRRRGARLLDVQLALGVSQPTARNLVWLGEVMERRKQP